MSRRISSSFVLTIILFLFCLGKGNALRSNETEVLAFQALQAYASMPSLHQFLSGQVKKNVVVKSIPGLFAQQNGVKPADGSYQLENFGALESWDSILTQLKQSPDQRLLIMIRHGQAWENLNPTSNANCEFTLNHQIVQNFDSPLTPLGYDQANSLNQQFRSVNPSSTSNQTWFETVGLAQDTTTFVTSPLSRTMQTTEGVFQSIPAVNVEGKGFLVNELLRATIGRDVCNFRRSVKTPTSSTVLPAPWQTGCQIPNDSLEEVYGKSPVHFTFNIRPAGGSSFGLISDYDNVWRSDVADDEIIQTRATAFLGQVFENTPSSSVVAVVTHGEMVSAIYEASGENSYGPKNTEVVPLMVKFN